MSVNVGKYIEELIARHGMTQADVAREIKVPRQLLCYVIGNKREMSLRLAMKLESFFSLADGELVKQQALQAVEQRKRIIRNRLCDKLMSKNAFWSYNIKSFDDISDEEIIEKSFTILDMEDIDLMFELYPRQRIKQVWKNRLAIQGDYMRRLNVMIAMYYFNINNPERYLSRIEKQHFNKILKNEIGVNF